MVAFLRWALVASGFVFLQQSLASPLLTPVRSGVAVTGYPQQLSGRIDVNGNGRPEVLVAGRWHVSIVEEDTGLRGYREVMRIDGPLNPFSSYLVGALHVDVPANPAALLLIWNSRIELRDAQTMAIKASVNGSFGSTSFDKNPLKDVDGDGIPDLVLGSANVGSPSAVRLYDPITLAARGNVSLPSGGIAVANIMGDGRAEIVSGDGRAYTLTRNGASLSATQVWSTNVSGRWRPYSVDVNGHPAIVLHDTFGYSAELATFSPSPATRTLVPSFGPSFLTVFTDANADERVDLIAATSSQLRAIDLVSGSTIWQADLTSSIGSAYGPIATDLDSDGSSELLWSSASNNSGVVAMTMPPTGSPRWRSDFNQSYIVDWTKARRADGSVSIAYLTQATQALPRLGSIGFMDGIRFSDQGGSLFSWLPGFTGVSEVATQNAITAFPDGSPADALVVVGTRVTIGNGASPVPWLWKFDGNGALQSARVIATDTTPQRVSAVQVLDRPERQLIVAGMMPRGTTGAVVQSARVQIVDHATGNVLWQSIPVPSVDDYGAIVTKLEVIDLDADGQLEVIVAHGPKVTVLRPSSGSAIVAEYSASQFSLLDRGVGRPVMLATVLGAQVAVYEGLSTTPEKTFTLPEAVGNLVLFMHAPDELMFASGHYGLSGLVVRSYADGQIVTSHQDFPGSSVAAMNLVATDMDGDNRIEIIGSGQGFNVFRVDNDYIFRNGAD